MLIRLATKADYKGVACSLRNKNIEYITSSHAKNDIENQCLFVMEEEGKNHCSMRIGARGRPRLLCYQKVGSL